MAVNKVPFGLYHLQDLGRTRRVMRGEGEFVGKAAYEEFGKLATVFYQQGSGPLIHPLWQTADAYFVELKLEQEPRPDYVRYTFSFWEAERQYSAQVERINTATRASAAGQAERGALIHVVVKGDCLWSIAQKYGVDLQTILQNNPQIKNPNLIYVGDEVKIR